MRAAPDYLRELADVVGTIPRRNTILSVHVDVGVGEPSARVLLQREPVGYDLSGAIGTRSGGVVQWDLPIEPGVVVTWLDSKTKSITWADR